MELITGDSSSDEDVEVGSASDPQDLNTLSTEMEDAQKDGASDTRPDKDDVCGGVVGDDFKVEWTDQFAIPVSYVQSRLFQYNTRQEGDSRRWKGVDWSVLMVVQDHQRTLGLFIGYNNRDQIPPGKKLHLKFEFQLLDLEDNVVYRSNSISHEFKHSDDDRNDHGQFIAFNNEQIVRYCEDMAVELNKARLSPEHLPLTMVPVRVRLLMEEVFRPATVPVGYHSKRATGMVGLENLGATCYLNALLQMLFHINSFRRAVYKLPHEGENITSSTTLALQSVFKNLQQSDEEVTTKDLTVAFGWTSAEAFLQQDVQEMMRVLVDKLEEKMRGTVMDGFIKRLFAGTVRSYIRCVHVQYESKRQEEFYDIQLDVKGCRNIYESFRKYTSIEMLDGENQYDAGEHGKQDAKKGVIFESFPPVLTIHLKRFDFDLNTMGFTKIHDYFEFPLRLEVDEFLAADCPAEARAVPNVYVLHSVLVHQGDVGGGHYYAYIRPATPLYSYGGSDSAGAAPQGNGNDHGEGSADPADEAHLGGADVPLSGFLASATNILNRPTNALAGKDQQWYKFNDETVLPVTQREAVDYCYGRRIRENEFFRSMSSAYMLVYIREAEAAEIMREVTDADIPTDLDARLNAERTQKLALGKRTERLRMYVHAGCVTEDDVRSFSDYSRTQDFVSDKSFAKFHVMRDITKLRMILELAQRLELPPCDFRLWDMEKTDSSGTFIITDDVVPGELLYVVRASRFYVERVDRSGWADDARAAFLSAYEALRGEETHLLDRLRADLLGCPELYYSEEEDPVDGCGIGSSNLPLAELMRPHPDKWNQYKRELDSLCDQMVELLTANYPFFAKEDSLVFVKFYDPYDMLPELSIPVEDSYESLSDGSSADGDDAGEDGDGNSGNGGTDADGRDGVSGGEATGGDVAHAMAVEGGDSAGAGRGAGGRKSPHKRRRSQKRAVPQEYLPVKYVGSLALSGDYRVADLGPYVFERLSAEHATIGNDWQDRFQRFQYYSSRGPLHCKRIAAKDVEAGVPVERLHRSMGVVVLYIDILPTQPMKIQVPYELTSVENWLAFRAHKKSLTAKPFDARDVSVLVRRHQERQERARQLEESGDAAAAAALSGIAAGGVRGIAASPASALASPTKRMKLPFGRERSASISSQRDRANSISSEFQSPMRPVLTANRKSLVGKPFVVEVALVMRVQSLLRRFAQELCVDPSHLALYFTPANGPYDAEERKHDIKPLTAYHRSMPINDALRSLEISTKANTKYVVYYRILPLSFTDEEGAERSLSERLASVYIADERLRYWRRMYLEHLRTRPPQNLPRATTSSTVDSVGGTLAAAAVGAAPAAPTGRRNSSATPPRSRANSEVSVSASAGSSAGGAGTGTRARPREVSIAWPQPVETSDDEYDPRETNYIHFACPVDCEVADTTDLIRDLIGIPTNIAQLEALKPTPAHTEAATGAARELLGSPDGGAVVCTGPTAVCSELLSLDATSGAIIPAYPLLLFNVRELRELQAAPANMDASSFVKFENECNATFGTYYLVGVQHVSPVDCMYMLNRCPGVRSVPVAVINFTLQGKQAVPCDPRLLSVGGPFISYVREDDDYYTVMRRFGAITGDKEDACKLRLAVIKEQIPYFLARPKTPAPAATGTDSQATQVLPAEPGLNGADGTGTGAGLPRSESLQGVAGAIGAEPHSASAVWDLLAEKYPLFVNSYHPVETVDHRKVRNYPILGIQRSSAEVAGKMRTGRGFGGGSIKIV